MYRHKHIQKVLYISHVQAQAHTEGTLYKPCTGTSTYRRYSIYAMYRHKHIQKVLYISHVQVQAHTEDTLFLLYRYMYIEFLSHILILATPTSPLATPTSSSTLLLMYLYLVVLEFWVGLLGRVNWDPPMDLFFTRR